MTERVFSRRELEKMVLAAAGGLLAGAVGGCGGGAPTPKPAGNSEDATADGGKYRPGRLLEDPHICRGLNTCINKGKTGTQNECAGRGNCATVTAHGCGGRNECGGQGGCGAHPGENTCKGNGGCAVPLGDSMWSAARKHFEELMTTDGQPFGEAPPKS